MLRVLPRLTLAVTEETVRKRKRVVILVSGAAAFLMYRVARWLTLLAEPLTLLGLSGCVSAVTALVAYRFGRGVRWAPLWREDGPQRLGWLTGWIGFVYGVQLSLMVLALLKVVVQYDFWRHPDGPAMMAIVIAATSVARDAFEIGHIRRLQRTGESVVTFPDGSALRALLREQPGAAFRQSVVGAAGAALAAAAARLVSAGRSDLGQLLVVSLAAGCLAVVAYLAGEQRPGDWRARLGSAGLSELFRFWWWPGLAFAATYYLVLAGGAAFVLRVEGGGAVVHGLTAAVVGGLMALYGYCLGYRRFLENRTQQTVPASLLRCPFVLSILSKSSGRPSPGASPVSAGEVAMGKIGRRR